VCSQVGKAIDPSVFETGGNPNARNLRGLFKKLEISDVFRIVRQEFELSWGIPQAEIFIADKLNEIVNHRHVVAHRASVLNAARGRSTRGIKVSSCLG
jgi:hypothetical protein